MLCLVDHVMTLLPWVVQMLISTLVSGWGSSHTALHTAVGMMFSVKGDCENSLSADHGASDCSVKVKTG